MGQKNSEILSQLPGAGNGTAAGVVGQVGPPGHLAFPSPTANEPRSVVTGDPAALTKSKVASGLSCLPCLGLLPPLLPLPLVPPLPQLLPPLLPPPPLPHLIVLPLVLLLPPGAYLPKDALILQHPP